MIRTAAFAAATVLLATSCVDSSIPPTSQTLACLDLAGAIDDLCERCEPVLRSYDACFSTFTNTSGRYCATATSIRNLDDLYYRCIPWTETVSCEESEPLDGSCTSQVTYY